MTKHLVLWVGLGLLGAAIFWPRLEFSESWENGYDNNIWHVEAARNDSIALVTDPVREGSYALEMNINPTDILPQDAAEGKTRVELKYFTPYRAGDTRWYAWSLFIPTTFVDPTDPSLSQIMGQFYDDPAENLTYADIRPSVSVEYGLDPITGNPGIAINYGVNGKNRSIIATSFIQKGQWNDFLFHVHWSKGNDGYIEVWHNGTMITPGRVYGPNKYTSGTHRIKLGIYRSPGHTTTNEVFYDRIRFGNARNVVE